MMWGALPLTGQDAYLNEASLECSMPTLSLFDMQLDLEESAAHLESLSRMLTGHALYLKANQISTHREDLSLVEGRVGSLALSIQDLKSAALKIAKII